MRYHLGMLTPEEIQQLLDQTSLQRVCSLDSAGSTNDEAKLLCADVDLSLPCLVIARNQTHGRGRRENTWTGDEGALTFSLIHDADGLRRQMGLSRRTQSLVALWTALAIRAALAEISDQHVNVAFRVKWPNDIYAGERKIGGILIEEIQGPVARWIIGIGLNVNNPAPALGRDTVQAVALKDVLDRELELFDVLLRVVNQLDNVFAQRPPSLRLTWHPHCYLRGRLVRVGDAKGICEGITDEGELTLQTDRGVVEVRSGSVELAS